jgi:hypothetical protein
MMGEAMACSNFALGLGLHCKRIMGLVLVLLCFSIMDEGNTQILR